MAAKLHRGRFMAIETVRSHESKEPSAAPDRPASGERRRRVRTNVHWPVTLFVPSSGDVEESITRNLTSSGFYCIVRTRLTIGERVIMLLHAPAHDPNDHYETCVFRCEGNVVRVDAPSALDGGIGVAVVIKDYSLRRASVRDEPWAPPTL